MTNVEKVIEKYGELIVESLQKRLAQGRKNASGTLSNSLSYKYSTYAGGYRIQVTGAKYLINVDRGRNKFIGRKVKIDGPFVKALINWIKVKPGLVAKGSKGPSQQAIKSYAIALAKKINKEGIKPSPLLSKGTAITKSTMFRQEIAKAQMKDSIEKLKTVFKVTGIYKGR